MSGVGIQSDRFGVTADGVEVDRHTCIYRFGVR